MVAAPNPLDPLLTAQQVGELIGLSQHTLSNKRRLCGQAFIPFIKLNDRDVRYRRSAVLAYIAEREAATPATTARVAARYIARERANA